MKIEIRSSLAGTPDLVRFFFKGAPLPEGLTEEEFDGSAKSQVLWREQGQRVLLVGLGEKEKFSGDVLRKASGGAFRAFQKIGAREIALDLSSLAEEVAFAVEGVVLASYKFEEFRPADKKRKKLVAKLTILVNDNEVTRARALAREADLLASTTNEIRALGNLPPNVLHPPSLATHVRQMTKSRSTLSVKILDERQLEKGGFGGILAVGQGSAHPPRLIVIEYKGGAKKEAPIALVGKAVTFDTGGISIKPADRMDEMKWDKMGGLAMLGVALAAADLKLPVNIVIVIPATENMPGSRAFRPGDILTTVDGKTIEVLNTDAEGRIILADGIAHARLAYKPRLIVEYSTLTGACVVALGGQRAGLFTTEDKLRSVFEAAGKVTGENVWALPIDEEYKEAVLSEVALAKNSAGREGGASTAASFVKLWAEEVPFVHVDIAGPAWITKDIPHLEKGATGFGVRLLVEALRTGLASA